MTAASRQIRADFERWYESDLAPIEYDWFTLDEDGYYEIDHVQSAWDAWLAAAEKYHDPH